jgi:hypothetical protein
MGNEVTWLYDRRRDEVSLDEVDRDLSHVQFRSSSVFSFRRDR